MNKARLILNQLSEGETLNLKMVNSRATYLLIGVLLNISINYISHACPPVSEGAAGDGGIEWVKKDDLYDQNQQSSTSAELCPVCQQDFSYFRGFELACGHKFHHHCLNDWAKQSFGQTTSGCPVCTQDIKMENGQSLDEFNEARDLELADKLREMWGVMAQFNYDIFKN